MSTITLDADARILSSEEAEKACRAVVAGEPDEHVSPRGEFDDSVALTLAALSRSTKSEPIV